VQLVLFVLSFTHLHCAAGPHADLCGVFDGYDSRAAHALLGFLFPQLLIDQTPAYVVNDLTTFAVVFLSSGLVFNPYVRAKLVQVGSLRTIKPWLPGASH
jgi:hypothetical protein